MPPVTESPAPHLSRWSFGVALAITLGIFFLLHPLWRPLDMSAMDRNIVWSYAAIPPLVLGLLALERKLRWSTFLLETLRLTFVKFAITFLFANLLWTIVPPPPSGADGPGGATVPAGSTGAIVATGATGAMGAASSSGAPGSEGSATAATGGQPSAAPTGAYTGRFDVRPAPPATSIDASRTGTVSGIVLDAAGAPLTGVLVAISGGLEHVVFAPRAEGVVLTHDGQELHPHSAVLLVYEPLTLRSATDGLHTIRALDEHGRQLFNTPLVARSERTLMFDRALGRVRLGCTVHESEPGAELAIVANPFAGWTGDDGRFRFEGVPSGALELTAWGPAGEPSALALTLEPGQVSDGLRLTAR